MEPPLQIEVLVDVMVTDGVTEVVVIVIELLVAMVGLAHGSLLVIFTDTVLPLERLDVVKVEAVPTLVGVDVNVTEEPLHIELLSDVMVTDGVTEVVVIVIELLVAMVGF